MSNTSKMFTETPPTHLAVLAVCEALREEDRQEFGALMPRATGALLADHFQQMKNRAIVWRMFGHVDHGAIALLGIWQTWPGVCEAGMVATDKFPLISTSMSIYLKRYIVPALMECGVRRVEVRAMKQLTRNCQWIEWLGARHEGDAALLGSGGETYAQYAWLNEAAVMKQEEIRDVCAYGK